MKLTSLGFLSFMAFFTLQTSCRNTVSHTINDNNTPSSAGPPNTAPGEEWVRISVNAGGMGLSEFQVMKYEAKAMLNDESASSTSGTDAAPDTHKPVSTKDHQPWRNISATDAAAESESLGSGYHLISNPEWMAIARDIESTPTNWTGTSVGSGCLFRGNSGEPTTGDGTSVTDSCGYNAATDPEEGSGRDTRAKHLLSNGSEIFDISGNVAEWTDWDEGTVGFQTGPTSCSHAELNSVACGTLADSDYNTSNGGYTNSDGAGYFYGGSGGAAHRGGNFNYNYSHAGVFSLDLNFLPSIKSMWIGFRCVYRPQLYLQHYRHPIFNGRVKVIY